MVFIMGNWYYYFVNMIYLIKYQYNQYERSELSDSRQ